MSLYKSGKAFSCCRFSRQLEKNFRTSVIISSCYLSVAGFVKTELSKFKWEHSFCVNLVGLNVFLGTAVVILNHSR